jgi:hypothetical protein
MGYVKNTIYSSVNRVIYGHVVRAWGGGSQYIPRLRVTDEYILIYSSVGCNRRIYFYITRYRRIYVYIFIDVIFLSFFIG